MPDYMFLLESRLSPEQRAVMLRVQELSAALGFNAYLTGGTVRDLVPRASLSWLLRPPKRLSDTERTAVRARTYHRFTNQPVRLLRVLRFPARMGFKNEQRTQEWFDLAIERNLRQTIAQEDAGGELRGV